MSALPDQLVLSVPGMSCGHCERSVTREVASVVGVAAIDIDLGRKLVTVRGTDLVRDAIVAAIDEAGYDVA